MVGAGGSWIWDRRDLDIWSLENPRTMLVPSWTSNEGFSTWSIKLLVLDSSLLAAVVATVDVDDSGFIRIEMT